MTTETVPDATYSRRWLILAVVGFAQMMVVLDATVVNIALPSAQHALHFSNGDRQWVITAYALAFGSLLPLGGRIGDLFGRKAAFLIGLIGFAACSAFGGLAQSFGWLVAARTAQGTFGALLAPSALAVLTTTFRDSPDRNRAFGIFGAIVASGGPEPGFLAWGRSFAGYLCAGKARSGARAQIRCPLIIGHSGATGLGPSLTLRHRAEQLR